MVAEMDGMIKRCVGFSRCRASTSFESLDWSLAHSLDFASLDYGLNLPITFMKPGSSFLNPIAFSVAFI